MKLLYNVLKQYIDFSLTPLELKDFLNDAGIEVEDFRDLSAGLRGKVFVGLVKEIKAREGNLKVLVVDVGQRGQFQVVTTSDIDVGDRVVYAQPGAVLPNGIEIRKREIKGFLSEGMLLSEEELGLSDKSETVIRHLPPELPPGSDPLTYLRLNDYLYDLYITPNRPDLMGLLGIAHEIAFLLGGQVRVPEVFDGMDEELAFPIEILDEEGCPRYTGRVIRGVKVKKSPDWLRYTLNLAGFRDINNVVDITNYVLWETGHPLHAFDLDKLKEKIIVRRARKGEKILSLDGVERQLDEDILVIADRENPVAIAGVIGGELSSVTEETGNILLESAYFDPPLIAKASRKLNVKTESSRRFERGADVEMAPFASHRATHLVRWLAEGRAGGLIDVYPKKKQPVVVSLDYSRISRFLGVNIPPEKIDEAMERMGAVKLDEGKFRIPSRRRDIETWQDVSEEIARFVGYDSIPDDETVYLKGVGDAGRIIYERAIRYLTGRGFYEAYTYSFLSREKASKFYENPIPLANPLSEEMSHLRPYVFTSLLEALSENIRRRLAGAKLVEWGSAFRDEEYVEMGIVAGGRKEPGLWQDEEYDFYELKGDIEAILEFLGLDYRFVPAQYDFLRIATDVIVDGKKIGFLGELKRSIARLFNIKQTVYVAELTLPEPRLRSLEDVSRFPPVFRDVSFLAPLDMPYSRVEELVRKIAEGIDGLKEFRLIDRYSGEQIPKGHVSYTFRLKFVSEERSLTDEEVDRLFEQFVHGLQSEGLKLRG